MILKPKCNIIKMYEFSIIKNNNKKKMKRKVNDEKLKKLLLGTIITALAMLTIIPANIVNAESAGPLYLGLTTFRSSGYGYKQGGKKSLENCTI